MPEHPHRPVAPASVPESAGASDLDFDLDDLLNHWEPEDLQESFIGFLSSGACIPQRIQFLAHSLLKTITLGIGSLSLKKRLLLQCQVVDIIQAVSSSLESQGTDDNAVPPLVFGPLAPPLRPSPPPYPYASFDQLWDEPICLQEETREFFSEILVSFPLFERLRVLSRALVITMDLAHAFSHDFDLKCSRSFLSFLLPRLSTSLKVLERVNPPPVPLPTDLVFGPSLPPTS